MVTIAKYRIFINGPKQLYLKQELAQILNVRA
jgi:hypothetical protein